MTTTRNVWRLPNLPKPESIPSLVLSKIPLVALPIAQICIGAKYLNECTKENYIPVYVLVSGVFGLFMALLTCLPCEKKDNPTLKCLCSIWHILVSSFTFCWFIAGNVWIYSIYPPNYNSTVVGVPYCNKTLYLFAFWTTTLIYILLALAFMCSCCYLIFLCVRGQDDESEEAPEVCIRCPEEYTAPV